MTPHLIAGRPLTVVRPPAPQSTTPARTLASMSDAELRLSAQGRISAAAYKYGADSEQVRTELARWGRMVDTRTAADDLTAVVDALVSPHLLQNRAAERARRASSEVTR